MSTVGHELALTAGQLVDRVEAYMGWTSPTAAQTAWALECVNDGYRRVHKGAYVEPGTQPIRRLHTWGFLRPKDATVILWPTIAVDAAVTVAGVYSAPYTTLTASEASFYPSMLGRTITITGVDDFVVTEYTSTTVIKVYGNATTAGATFSFTADGCYGLEDDFGGIDGDVVFLYDGTVRSDMEWREPSVIDAYHRNSSDTGEPEFWTVQARTPQARVQVWSGTVISSTLGHTFILTVTSTADGSTTTIAYAAILNDTPTIIAAALAALWNASVNALCVPVTASSSGAILTLIADAADTPFNVAFSSTSTGTLTTAGATVFAQQTTSTSTRRRCPCGPFGSGRSRRSCRWSIP
jgi:hypothetical protein